METEPMVQNGYFGHTVTKFCDVKKMNLVKSFYIFPFKKYSQNNIKAANDYFFMVK